MEALNIIREIKLNSILESEETSPETSKILLFFDKLFDSMTKKVYTNIHEEYIESYNIEGKFFFDHNKTQKNLVFPKECWYSIRSQLQNEKPENRPRGIHKVINELIYTLFERKLEGELKEIILMTKNGTYEVYSNKI